MQIRRQWLSACAFCLFVLAYASGPATATDRAERDAHHQNATRARDLHDPDATRARDLHDPDAVDEREAHKKKTASDELTPAWQLARQAEGEPYWAPLLRLREAEAQYRGTPQWGAYAQLRAYLECNVGDHFAALAAWDAAFTPRDSVGTLPAGIVARDAIKTLSAVADTARVIMINERHHAASDRLLTLALLPILRDKGFRYFAAEAFDPRDSGLNQRPYPVAATGTYLRDPVFAEIVREALRLGYTLVPYESMRGEEAGDDSMTTQQRRDFTEARNLAQATVAQDQGAKILVHAGYSHVLERASERFTPMALYFRQLTGIDPVTVDQTRLSERSEAEYEAPAYRACLKAGLLKDRAVILFQPNGKPYAPVDFAVDYQVFTPRTHYEDGRPSWMRMGGLRHAIRVDVPEAEDEWCMVEARVPDEPDEAIPLDRCELEGTQKATLFVPPLKKFILWVRDRDGELLRKTLVTNPRSDDAKEEEE
ncbi:MAG TPA: hypothetical protein VKA63_00765 [Candidatus Krumholzibacteria bacterium]|nr:hypothetical protein [Candidatus Krumholzibacteria bacterium]